MPVNQGVLPGTPQLYLIVQKSAWQVTSCDVYAQELQQRTRAHSKVQRGSALRIEIEGERSQEEILRSPDLTTAAIEICQAALRGVWPGKSGAAPGAGRKNHGATASASAGPAATARPGMQPGMACMRSFILQCVNRAFCRTLDVHALSGCLTGAACCP